MNEKRFYLVWSPTGPHVPRYRHATGDAAKAEAERLATAHPGQEFYVLGALSMSTIPAPKPTTVDLVAHEFPF